MTTENLKQIGELLSKVGSPGIFTCRRTAPADDLILEVKGLGRLRFPISRTQAERLCRIARPARYGLGEQTLLDRKVRDTWEIPKSRVKIDRRKWNQTLLPVLGALRTDLGLPDTCRLKAALHAMLVYAPGQFFLPHQDSEKADDMLGTLVVTLPASFRGGAILVEHQGEKVIYRGSGQRLSFIAFYADCRHEVRPVKEGYRIVLTYNLMRDHKATVTETGAAELEPATVEALVTRLREHFETPRPPRSVWTGEDASPKRLPRRLVYLLDHQYTEGGFSWHNLKGNDAARAAALRAAAERCGCELVLALADVHETWSCMEQDWDEPWGGRHRHWERDEDDEWHEDDPPADGPDTYELVDLVDWEITLSRWIDPSGTKAASIVAHVNDAEVCSTTPSSALEPYASEYEGYMGNYGNTMDRWYRRAAIVLWPRERGFIVRAEASPAWALKTLSQRIRTGALPESREMAMSMLPFWGSVAPREGRRGFFDQALRVAEGLDASSPAASLLQPFGVEDLTPGRAPAFVALTKLYGDDWVRQLLEEWSAPHHRRGRFERRDPLEWLAVLPRLCEALRLANDDDGTRAARLLLQNRWKELQKMIEESRHRRPPSLRNRALLALAEPILRILESTAVIESADLLDEAVTFLCTDENDLLLPCLVKMLRVAEKAVAPELRTSMALDSFQRHCVRHLKVKIELPARADDDWSIALPEDCRCKLCGTLASFLTDSSKERLEWPLAKEGRRHVHGRLDADELPVQHETWRSGRPYTLVLRKTKELFERDARERRSWKSDLDWLTKRASTSRSRRTRGKAKRRKV